MRPLFAMVMWGLVVWPFPASAQEVVTDQVSITSAKGQVFGITSGEGITRLFLASGEDILVIESRGLTGYVQTTKQLLGFSGRQKRWVHINLPAAEEVTKWTVTSHMIVVQGWEAAYGFQSDLGRWKKEPWGAGERLVKSVVDDRVGVLITNRRALGFSASTG